MPEDKALLDELDELLSEDVRAVIERERTAFDRAAGGSVGSLVLFGAGNLGRKTLAGLRRSGIEPLAFADSDRRLWGTTVDGTRVLSPSDAAQTFGQGAVFVVAVWSPGDERRVSCIKGRLAEFGCRKIVSFVPLFWKYPEIFLPHYRLDLPHKVYRQADDIRRAFSLWEDEDSRREYCSQLRWELSADFGEMPWVAREAYLPDEIFTLSREEFFVDCGAFDGDTIRKFLEHGGNAFDRIVAFEPDPANFENLRGYVSRLPVGTAERIDTLRMAVGARREKLTFEAMGTVSSAISSTGTLEVECAPLDEVLAGRVPTYIKMDIEGAEPDALAGARRIIAETSPALAVCVYHRQDHLWTLPLLINSFRSGYRFFLRRYGDEFGDVVCYAVPENRLRKR